MTRKLQLIDRAKFFGLVWSKSFHCHGSNYAVFFGDVKKAFRLALEKKVKK